MAGERQRRILVVEWRGDALSALKTAQFRAVSREQATGTSLKQIASGGDKLNGLLKTKLSLSSLRQRKDVIWTPFLTRKRPVPRGNTSESPSDQSDG